MYCGSCASSGQAEFTAEINIHFRGPQNLAKPGVLVFPKVLVCLDCGFSRFITPETELARLVQRHNDQRNLNPKEGVASQAALFRTRMRLSSADHPQTGL